MGSDQLGAIAGRYGVTTAQLCLRWNLQKGVVPLPKSTHAERIRANLDVFGFEITDEDMNTIDDLPYLGGMAFDPDSARS